MTRAAEVDGRDACCRISGTLITAGTCCCGKQSYIFQCGSVWRVPSWPELPLNLSAYIYLMAESGRTCLFLPLSEGTVDNRAPTTCRGAIIRTLTAAGIKGKPEGKLRRGEGHCKNTPTSTQKEQKKKREEKCSSLKAGSAVRTDAGQAAALSTAISEPSVFLSKHQSARRG